MFTAAIRSTKTTVVAVLLAVSSLLTTIAYQVDGNPDTIPNWNETVTILLVAIGLFFARDSDKKSEDVIG